MNFIPVSSIKSKPVKIEEGSNKTIEDYAKYVSSQRETDFDTSDIVTNILLDDGFEKDLKSSPAPKFEKINLKLPEAAWKKLDRISKETGKGKDEILDLISKKLIADKKFLGWQKSVGSKSKQE